ncbi:MAG: AMP-binding enzyme, partial [Sphingopyxis sp.]
SGGVNIYPQEIENALGEHPAIADVAVFGAPDPDFGERVVAVAELIAGVMASDELAEDIRRFARDRVGGLKAPKQVDFIDTLPREPTGKLFKKKLVEDYRQRAEYGNQAAG